MPIATNPDSGDVMFLDGDSQWKTAKTAVNPQTREMMAFDGKDWQKVTTHGHGVLGYIDDAVRAVASGMTFGYADEFAAKMGELTGVGGKKGDYEGNVAKERARDAAAPSAIRIPGEIAGAVAGSVAAAPIGAAAGAVSGLSKLPAAAKAIAGGAAAGGLYASGEADGGLENRLAAVPGGAAAGAVGGAAMVGIGKIVGAAGDKIMTSVIKPSKADIEDGFSLNTIKEYNLGGSLRTSLTKTQDLMNSVTDELRQKLASSPSKVDLTSVYDQTKKALLSENKLKSFGANAKIQSALDNLQNEVLEVSGGKPLAIPDAQVVKQAAGHFGAWQFGRPDPESKASEIVYSTFYNKLKTSIEDNSPAGVKELNQQLSKLIPVSHAIIRRLPVAERNSIISLPEWIGLATATAHPGALGLTGLSLLSRSGSAGNLMSKLGTGTQAMAPAAGAVAGGMLGGPSPLTGQ